MKRSTYPLFFSQIFLIIVFFLQAATAHASYIRECKYGLKVNVYKSAQNNYWFNLGDFYSVGQWSSKGGARKAAKKATEACLSKWVNNPSKQAQSIAECVNSITSTNSSESFSNLVGATSNNGWVPGNICNARNGRKDDILTFALKNKTNADGKCGTTQQFTMTVNNLHSLCTQENLVHQRFVGDFNGNGLNQEVRRDASGFVFIYTEGQAPSTSDRISPLPLSLNDWVLRGVGDVDNDGTDDLIWQHKNGRVVFWRIRNNKADGGGYISDFRPTFNNHRLLMVDYDGDGRDELLWQNGSTGRVLWWELGSLQGGTISSQQGTIPRVSAGLMPNTGYQGALQKKFKEGWTLETGGDFNNDGLEDVVWRKSNGQVVRWIMSTNNNPNNKDKFPVTFNEDFVSGIAPGFQWRILGTTDMNSDRVDDILWENDGSTADGSSKPYHFWQLNHQGQRVKSGNALTVAIPTFSLHEQRFIGDFNGDGIPQELRRTAQGHAFIYTEGGPTYATASNRVHPHAPSKDWAIGGVGDVDGDGDDDIIWRYIPNGRVHYWRIQNNKWVMSGDITYHKPPVFNHRFVMADITGDGKDEILWQRADGGVVYWKLGNFGKTIHLSGSGWIANTQNKGSRSKPFSREWRLAGAGDLDGNGTDDILWRDGNGQLSRWLMNENFTVASEQPVLNHAPDWDWFVLGVTDMNGDGIEDILWENENDNVTSDGGTKPYHYWQMVYTTSSGQTEAVHAGSHSALSLTAHEGRFLQGCTPDVIFYEAVNGQQGGDLDEPGGLNDDDLDGKKYVYGRSGSGCSNPNANGDWTRNIRSIEFPNNASVSTKPVVKVCKSGHGSVYSELCMFISQTTLDLRDYKPLGWDIDQKIKSFTVEYVKPVPVRFKFYASPDVISTMAGINNQAILQQDKMLEVFANTGLKLELKNDYKSNNQVTLLSSTQWDAIKSSSGSDITRRLKKYHEDGNILKQPNEILVLYTNSSHLPNDPYASGKVVGISAAIPTTHISASFGSAFEFVAGPDQYKKFIDGFGFIAVDDSSYSHKVIAHEWGHLAGLTHGFDGQRNTQFTYGLKGFGQGFRVHLKEGLPLVNRTHGYFDSIMSYTNGNYFGDSVFDIFSSPKIHCLTRGDVKKYVACGKDTSANAHQNHDSRRALKETVIKWLTD